MGTDVNSGEKVSNGMTMAEIWIRAHVLKYSHRRCTVGAFDKNLNEGYICTRQRTKFFKVHKKYFLHFVHNGTKLYDRYIYYDDRKKLMMMGLLLFQNRRLEIFILLNIRRHMVIEVMLFQKVILNI